jgi:hypothetical protein
MPEAQSAADSLVFRAIRPDREEVRADSPERQELPRLDLLGAAIARAARLAAAEDRAQRVHHLLRRSQAAGLFAPHAEAPGDLDQTERGAETQRQAREAHMFSELLAGTPDEGRVVLLTAAARGFVWRLHPAPAEAACDGRRGTVDEGGKPLAPLDFGASA